MTSRRASRRLQVGVSPRNEEVRRPVLPGAGCSVVTIEEQGLLLGLEAELPGEVLRESAFLSAPGCDDVRHREEVYALMLKMSGGWEPARQFRRMDCGCAILVRGVPIAGSGSDGL